MTTKRRETTWVECGRIGRAVGLRGEVAVFWNNGECPVAEGGELFLSTKANPEERGSMTVAALREQGRLSVARFEGSESREAAEKLRGGTLWIPAERLPRLPENEYYSYEILGLEVFLESGKLLGKVVRIFTAGENDVYEVSGEDTQKGKEILLPARADIILKIDLDAGRMTVRPMDGMLD